ncbi:MAG: pilus assembly PilX N-terminal domain-containing protein [Planctomycetota bacterium]|jgi:hypothetical protein
MNRIKKPVRRRRHGSALLIATLFVLIFSALAVGLATMSGTNLQIANNQQKANCARACAESGLEIMRLWLSQVSIPGETPATEKFDLIATSFQSETYDISYIMPYYDGSSVTVPSTTLDLATGQCFYGDIIALPPLDDPNTLQVDITGEFGQVTKTLRVIYEFGVKTHPIFDYGVATKGPLTLAGNIELEGANVSVESSVFIESPNSTLSLSIIGNSAIAGDVYISNPLGTVDLQGGQASIGGETGQAAIDNHVNFGVESPGFPTPDPGYFEHYALNIVDSTTDTSSEATFENIRIVAGTHPIFASDVTLNGVVFIETPNIVTFEGSATVTGILVGDGSVQDDSATNQVNFAGNVVSYPVSSLPDEPQFTGIKQESGTFLMAPGFHVSFGGNFGTLNGAIAGNGIEFYGDAGGTINGTIINYSDEPMNLSGNNDLLFNNLDSGELPSGFAPLIILNYDPSSYSESPF